MTTATTETRWYVITPEGRAKLCADENEARKVAHEWNMFPPAGKPYKAVLLGDVSAIAAERDAMREALRDQPGLAERAFFKMQSNDAKAHAYRMAMAPPGACPSCYGDGEQGGQFCGGFWQCESCGGTGKA
jgi:hypothetical protein